MGRDLGGGIAALRAEAARIAAGDLSRQEVLEVAPPNHRSGTRRLPRKLPQGARRDWQRSSAALRAR